MDIKHILSLPPDERDFEIWKLLYPDTWKEMQGIYSKYHMNDEETAADFAKQVGTKLDWNLAMKMRDDMCNHKTAIHGPWRIYQAVVRPQAVEAPNEELYLACDMWHWFVTKAQPHHYILAAIQAGG